MLSKRQEKTKEANKSLKENPTIKVTQEKARPPNTINSYPMGAFAYEEEIIETYKYTEDRPLRKKNIETRLDLGEAASLSFDVPIVTSESNDYTDSERSKVTGDEHTDHSETFSFVCSEREKLTDTENRKAYSVTTHSPTDERNFSFVYRPSCYYTCSKESPRKSAIPRWTPRT